MQRLDDWRRFHADLLPLFDDDHAPFFRPEPVDPVLRSGHAQELGGRASFYAGMPVEERRFPDLTAIQLRIDHATDAPAIATTRLERLQFCGDSQIIYREALLSTAYVDGEEPVEATEPNASDQSGNLDLVNWFEVPLADERWNSLLQALSDIACYGRYPAHYRGR